jgi:hypothetical protein
MCPPQLPCLWCSCGTPAALLLMSISSSASDSTTDMQCCYEQLVHHKKACDKLADGSARGKHSDEKQQLTSLHASTSQAHLAQSSMTLNGSGHMMCVNASQFLSAGFCT